MNREEGFVGTSMRKDELVCDCSDLDDIIIFTEDGVMKVIKVDSKVLLEKILNIFHYLIQIAKTKFII